MGESTKDIRLQVLVDESFSKMVRNAAHESWMSVGQYMRDIVQLFEGGNYDTAADQVMIGKEVGLDGHEILREMAERRKISVNEFCLSLARKGAPDSSGAENEEISDVNQLDLFK